MLSLLATALLSVPAPASPASREALFPMEVVADHGAEAGLELALRPELVAALAQRNLARFVDVPLADGTRVEVEAARFALDDSELVVMVDGIPSSPLDGVQSMWTGVVPGDPDSDVFLAFSPLGSRGWIRRGGETHHLLAGPGASGEWSESRSFLVDESTLLARGMRAIGCAGDPLAVPGRPLTAAPSSTGGGTQALGTTLLTCRIAVEHDFQLYQAFGNLAAEQNYATQLFAADSGRYFAQVSTTLQRVYAAYYTTNSDPWVAPDIGGTTIDALYELQAHYAGNHPNGAHLTTLWSGAALGGGVAWLDVLCHPDFGFSVSANLTLQGGLTPFPVVQGPLTWDFFVTSHEIGHNFGTPHTHDFCPPIDECAFPGSWGVCQTQQVCISTGTIMSYCHQCPGGMSDVSPFFAQACADLMRQRAEASCFGAVCPTPVNFCPATINGTGLPGIMSSSGSQQPAANTFTLIASQLPANKTAFFFYGNVPVQVAVGQGWRCAGGSVFRLQPAQNSGPTGSISRLLNFAAPPAGSGSGVIVPGMTRYFQAFYRNPAGGGTNFNLTDALEVEFCP